MSPHIGPVTLDRNVASNQGMFAGSEYCRDVDKNRTDGDLELVDSKMMDLSQRKEQFSRAYVHAVATVAGYGLFKHDVDDDSIDLGIASSNDYHLPTRPRLELQLKCTSSDVVRGGNIVFRLKRKNYDDLRLTNIAIPRILVVVLAPDNESEWVHQSEEELVLRGCAYWTSLHGSENTKNRRSISVSLPRKNVFSVEGLHGLMRRADQKEPL